MQEKVSKICREKLNPALDDLFGQLVKTDEIFAIEKIEIDVGDISLQHLESELVEKIIRQLELQIPIQLLPDAKGTVKQTQSQSRFQMWLMFLEKGTLPWQVGSTQHIELEKAVLENIASNQLAKEKLKSILRKNSIARQRLILQHSIEFFEKLIDAFTGSPKFEIQKLYTELESLFFSIKKKKWKGDVILKRWKSEATVLKKIFLKQIIEQYIINEAEKDLLEQSVLVFLEKNIEEERIVEFVNVLLQKIKTNSSNSFSKVSPLLEKVKLQLEKKIKPKNKTEKEFLKSKDKNRKKETHSSTKPLETKESSSIDNHEKGEKGEKGEKEKITKKGKQEDHDPFAGKEIQNQENQDTMDKEEFQEIDEIDFESTPEGTSYYIANAGVILVHPFVSNLFKNFELLKDKEFKDSEAQELAIHLIQFLATGNTQMAEYELLLPKFLCGLPFKIPIAKEVSLTETQKEECNKLLEAMINHWGVLGNTVPDGLREGFLQREGKLSKRQNGWYLQVEEKTMDLLLDKLPWNLSMIRLPWMKEVLNVEWH